MAFVSGLGGGHANASYFETRKNTMAQKDGKDCGCINISLERPKKKSKIRLMKERIRQFSIWFFENEDHKEVEHVRRRLERKKKRKLLKKSPEFRHVCWLYGFDVILWIVGSVFTLCSTVKAFGKHTVFYKSGQLYRILGPGLLLAAAVVLFLATGLKHRMKTKHDRPQRSFYIVQKNKKHSKSDTDIKDPDNDSGNEEDIEMTEFSLKRESDLKTGPEGKPTKEAKVRKLGDMPIGGTMSGEKSEIVFYNEGLKRTQNRRAWAKTKWMRMESGSGDSFESDDILDLVHDDPSKEENESRETHAELPSNVTKMSTNRRIMRFKPLSGGCFTAQSSIRSQASEISFASTTSESALLVRK
ncbi:uncharacterized protein LOC123564299 [Mercenaria mercenaria]|uniref:uncharacterized protein LOC123564299 n=1 Tax=Mercenaria mercenaria TaxID=6596 RepID=UPI00234E7964|nr:uncharacterized protein LOC123564299 [Mercenaria mercenaria]